MYDSRFTSQTSPCFYSWAVKYITRQGTAPDNRNSTWNVNITAALRKTTLTLSNVKSLSHFTLTLVTFNLDHFFWQIKLRGEGAPGKYIWVGGASEFSADLSLLLFKENGPETYGHGYMNGRFQNYSFEPCWLGCNDSSNTYTTFLLAVAFINSHCLFSK